MKCSSILNGQDTITELALTIQKIAATFYILQVVQFEWGRDASQIFFTSAATQGNSPIVTLPPRQAVEVLSFSLARVVKSVAVMKFLTCVYFLGLCVGWLAW
jgi:hypothetical protein